VNSVAGHRSQHSGKQLFQAADFVGGQARNAVAAVGCGKKPTM